MPSIELKDIEQVAVEIKTQFEAFKAKNDEQIELIAKELGTLKRPGAAGFINNTSTEGKAAFTSFIRKGDATGLQELEQKSMSVGSDPDGGFAVPEFIEQDIEKLEIAASAIMQLGRIVEAKGSVYKKLVNKRGTASGWVGETDGRPETGTPQMEEVSIEIGELYANPKLTQKLIDDAMFNAEAFITEEITEEFSDQLGAALINGDGVNKPKGVLQYPTTAGKDSVRAFGTLQSTESGTSSTFDFDDIKALKSSLKSKYRMGAAWVLNETTALIISTFKDANGRYIWQEAVKEDEHDTLLGYPVYIDENMPDVAGGSFPILFGNFDRGYHIPKRLGVRLLRDPYTSKPYVNFYATSRIGGGVVNSEAIKLLKIAV